MVRNIAQDIRLTDYDTWLVIFHVVLSHIFGCEIPPGNSFTHTRLVE